MSIETYEQAVQYWNSRVNYEKVGMPQDLRTLKLDRMRLLLQLLGNPQEQYRVIHISGTKGKGSTAAMLASILRASGHRTGLYTSPHLVHIEERVQINGDPIPAEDLVSCMRTVAAACEEVERRGETGPTFFEIITAVGVLHFARRQVDWAVLEVGLGGRFDATNACRPEVAVITSISLDHMEQLGPDLESIAFEKAGIIKPGQPVIVGVREEGPRAVIEQVARERKAPLQLLGRDFERDWQPGDPARLVWPQVRLRTEPPGPWLTLPLWGEHQADNAAVALATVNVLRQNGVSITDEQVRVGLANTTIPARLEIVGRRPWLVLDCAHNVASIERLVEWLQHIPARRRLMLFAISRDKEITEILRLLLGQVTEMCFTRYRSSARGADPAELLNQWQALGGPGGTVTEPADMAWASLKRQGGPDDLVCATGSVFLAGEVRQAELAGRLARLSS
jgi:dihydrofolate synthase/folylpolyglutamate synthase